MNTENKTYQREISVFDLIGPIMVGPSSSHTAGAVRLGQIGRNLFGSTPQFALIELHGSFALTGRGHGTDKALVAGLLGWPTADDRIRHSLELAPQLGLQVEFTTIDLGEDVHPNTVRVTLSGGERSIQYCGASTGGGMVEITQVRGYPVSFTGEYHTLLVIADDQPGTINTLTGCLFDHQINVAFLNVGRLGRGGQAIMTFETDQPIPPALIEQFHALDWVDWVCNIPRREE